MEASDISRISRQQHKRKVSLVEINDGTDQVRIVIHVNDGGQLHGRGSLSESLTCDGTPIPEADASTVTVKSEALGIFRLAHPAQPDKKVLVGGEVTQGDVLALLQVGNAYTQVPAPCTGTICGILAEEGQLIDYGKPLFLLKGTD